MNVGPPGAPTNPLSHIYTAPDGVTTANASPEFLLLTNGIDDNADGYIDNGWDGINDGNWELETWRPGQPPASPTRLTRSAAVRFRLPLGRSLPCRPRS